jgi:hypothetical protein
VPVLRSRETSGCQILRGSPWSPDIGTSESYTLNILRAAYWIKCAMLSRPSPVHQHLFAQPNFLQSLTSPGHPAAPSHAATLEVRTSPAPCARTHTSHSIGFVLYLPELRRLETRWVRWVHSKNASHSKTRASWVRPPNREYPDSVLPPTPPIPKAGDTGSCI